MYEEVKEPPGSSLDPNVQQYSDILKRQYNRQHTVEADWPTRYGDDFFGRLILLQIKDNYVTANTLKHKAFLLLRGKVDKISDFDKSKSITTKDVLKPNNDHHPLSIVVDGPPGIGKTTLCRKILKMWANGEITHEVYDLVLYCPLRNEKVANASTLTDLFTIESQRIYSVVDWITRREGKGLLIIFDGWDELSEQHKQTSLAAEIIRREKIFDSSVIVTSRTYASASLLKVPSIDRHVEVVGFSEDEVKEVIRGTLREDPDQAQKLIEHLEIRGDALSLCYIPFICSIVISVFRTKEQFPATLTEWYHDLIILQTIRRHVEINRNLGIRPEQLKSLNDLPSVVGEPMNQLCKLAYDGLKEKSPRMTFTTSQLESGLKDAVKRKYLGLMTTFTVSDIKNHQFLHLTIQEFLAAMWIADNNIGEEVFKKYYGNDHFRMCLRFVAGLTHLENIYDQVIESMQDQRSAETVNDQSNDYNSDQNFQTTQEQDLELNIHEQHFKNIEDTIHEWPGDFSELDEEFDCLEVGWSCLREPAAASGYEAYCYSKFHQNTEILSNHWKNPNKFSSVMLAFQVLYEAQNISYCQKLAEDLDFNEIPSLCLIGKNLSPFDMLCVSYFLRNSNMKWNHLHFDEPKQLKIFADSLLKHPQHNSTCNIFEIDIGEYNIPSKFWSSSFLCNITECYCDYSNNIHISILLLTELLKLSKLKVLHLRNYFSDPHTSIDYKMCLEQCSKIKESLQKNCVMQEIMFKTDGYNSDSEQKDHMSKFTISFIDGITANRSIKSLSIDINCTIESLEFDTSMVVSLLKDNHTLQALKLHVPKYCWKSESIPSTIEVNTPLTAVDITGNSQLTKLIIQNCKTLLYVGPDLPCSPSDLFFSQPYLQQVDLSLTTVEQAIELFTILKSNSTLTALRANIMSHGILTDSGVGVSLKNMLEENKKMQHLEILFSDYMSYRSMFNCFFPETYLPFMTAGLKHNSTLRGLCVPIPLSHASVQTVASLLEVISYKHNICELHMNIYFHKCSSQNVDEANKLISSFIVKPSDKELTELYCSLQLPFVNKILKKNAKMKILEIIFRNFYGHYLKKEKMPLPFLELMVLCHCHPSLQYLKIPYIMTIDHLKKSLRDQAVKQGYGRFIKTHLRNSPPLFNFSNSLNL